MRYIALIDGQSGAYGVVFPDLPGCTAMGASIEEALANAAEALEDWAAEVVDLPVPSTYETLKTAHLGDLVDGALLASVALVRNTGRPARVNMSLDGGVLAAIDAEAARRKMTRSGFVEVMAKQVIPTLA